MVKYIRTTINTKFHIDFSWWKKQEQNLNSYLQSHACQQSQEDYQNLQDKIFDWIDPTTGELFQLDMLWYIIRTCCSSQPDFINDYTPLTSVIFRIFIANNNTPLTSVEIQEIIPKKAATTILKTIGGRRIYKGIRPVVV